ncbi:hypothetical protein lerEdw1_013575 [Lerista edwardsae]|nr:hypothetical protein lerEdw1_013577 [Lerista edwardsae]KAJ6644764.1 hypothetical protein lerEdw1_013575 [Lerista edwardsae]
MWFRKIFSSPCLFICLHVTDCTVQFLSMCRASFLLRAQQKGTAASFLSPFTMSWQNLLVELLLITGGVLVMPEEMKMATAESTPSTTQTKSHAQAETTITPKVANITQTTGQAVTHRAVNTTIAATRTLVTSSEPRTDQTGIHMPLKTTLPAQRTASKSEPSSSQKTTIPVVSTATGNANKTAADSTIKHIAQSTAAQATNSWAHSNRTSVRAERKVPAPRPTAPVGPTLAPKPSPAAVGAYSVSNGTAECIKAQIGLTMIVKNSQTQNPEYLNVDPNVTHTTGVCGNGQASITILFQGGFIRFHFIKNGERYFVGVIEASLTVSSESTPYSGIKTEQLFSTPVGSCFKCLTKQTVDMASNFQLWMVNSQLQAFDIVGNQFGKGKSLGNLWANAQGCLTECRCASGNSSLFLCNALVSNILHLIAENECALDRNKRMIPIAVGLSLAGLLLIAFVTWAIYRRKPHSGYDRI